MSLSRKISAATGLIVIMVIGLVTYVIAQTTAIEHAYTEQRRITEVRKVARQLDANVLRIIISLEYYTDTNQVSYLDDIARDRQEADQQRQKIHTLARLPEAKDRLTAFESILPQRRQAADAIVAAIQNNVAAAELTQLKQQRRDLDDQARASLRQIISLEEAAASQATEKLQSDIVNARRNLIVAAVIVTFVVIAVIGSVIKAVLQPLHELTGMARSISMGNLNVTNTVDSNDEMGVLGRNLNIMANELQRVDDIKNNFISIASHQLRTPATAVKQNLGLIVEGYATEEADKERFIRGAFESNEYQLAIIEDILNVARIQSGTLRLDKKPSDLGELVDHAVNEQRLSLKPGQKLTYTKPRQPIQADIDHIKITMCVGNLISNAIKYTPENGTIDITVLEAAGEAVIKIADSGVGIAEADMDKLFGRFNRVDNELSSQVSGTGLGLYLVKQLVELHNGHVNVESTPGKGSTFTITLPLKS